MSQVSDKTMEQPSTESDSETPSVVEMSNVSEEQAISETSMKRSDDRTVLCENNREQRETTVNPEYALTYGPSRVGEFESTLRLLNDSIRSLDRIQTSQGLDTLSSTDLRKWLDEVTYQRSELMRRYRAVDYVNMISEDIAKNYDSAMKESDCVIGELDRLLGLKLTAGGSVRSTKTGKSRTVSNAVSGGKSESSRSSSSSLKIKASVESMKVRLAAKQKRDKLDRLEFQRKREWEEAKLARKHELEEAERQTRLAAIKREEELLMLQREREELDLKTEIEAGNAQIKVYEEAELEASRGSTLGSLPKMNTVGELFLNRHDDNLGVVNKDTLHEGDRLMNPKDVPSNVGMNVKNEPMDHHGKVEGGTNQQRTRFKVDDKLMTRKNDLMYTGHRDNVTVTLSNVGTDILNSKQGYVQSKLSAPSVKSAGHQLPWYTSAGTRPQYSSRVNSNLSASAPVFDPHHGSAYGNQHAVQDCSGQGYGHTPSFQHPYQSFPYQQPWTSNHPHQSSPVSTQAVVDGSFGDITLAQTMADVLAVSRLPVSKPTSFSGDPLKFSAWMTAFKHSVSNPAIKSEDKMLLLEQCLEGSAKEAVGDLFLQMNEASYENALAILKKRYGEDFIISEALKDKLENWPSVGSKDYEALRKYADYLRQCNVMSSTIKGLTIFNDPAQIRKLTHKLSQPLIFSWTRRAHSYQQGSGEYPPFSEFVGWIQEEADILRNADIKNLPKKQESGGSGGRNANAKSVRSKTTDAVAEVPTITIENEERKSFSINEAGEDSCLQCKKAHKLIDCLIFKAMKPEEKRHFAKQNELCYHCLSKYHFAKGCRARFNCDVCQRYHHTNLHGMFPGRSQAKPGASFTNVPNPGQQNDNMGDQEAVNCHRSSGAGQLYSLYVPVWLSSALNPDHEVKVYAMLDVQSDTSFIVESIADTLEVPFVETELNLSTITSTRQKTKCREYRDLRLRPEGSNVLISIPEAYSRDSICETLDQIPSQSLVQSLPLLQHLAPYFQEKPDAPVALLIGSNVVEALKPLEVVDGGPNLYAQRSVLGWGIVGNVQDETGEKTVAPAGSHTVKSFRVRDVATEKLVKLMERDFACHDDHPMSQEDQRFLNIMKDNITLNEEGHYEMPLPFKSSDPQLPNNIVRARQRLKSLQVKFSKDQEHYRLYKDFMTKMIDLKDAEVVPEDEINNEPVWYIPHHGVYNPSKPGKIRVVFDCAAKHHGTSLNDHLLSGPDLLNSLPGVLCRFRLFPVAFACDVERMFHMFHVASQHRDYLRFLWWPNGDVSADPVPHRMRVHLFGATSSPGCANYALRQLAQDHSEVSEAASEFIHNDFYVDDGLHSDESESQAVQLLKDAREICQHGQLRLHKITSNSQAVLASFPSSEVTQLSDKGSNEYSDSAVERALGLRWSLNQDVLTFRFEVTEKEPSKRNVLSMVASIFDPLGLVSPVILPGRLVLQEACRAGLGWDQILSKDQLLAWFKWLENMSSLSTTRIPRCYFQSAVTPWSVVELHHFSDASLSGYGECSYLRVVDATGSVHSALVMAKSRVAPLRSITVPRLELQAAVLAVRVASFLQRELNLPSLTHHFWTDSRVVLGYIYNQSKRFQVFVANRVQQILDFSCASQWHHIPTDQNPADFASRGLSVDDLQSSFWFSGPDLLRQESIEYIELEVEVSDSDVEVKAHSSGVDIGDDVEVEVLLQRFSSLSKLVRFVQLCRVWISKVRKSRSATTKLVESVKPLEVLSSVFRRIQAAHFSESQRAKLPELSKLDIIVDDEGLLRVGGRLKRSVESFPFRHPVVLPRKSHIAVLLATHHHVQEGHQGRTTTMSALRVAGYWICGARRVVSSVIQKCVQCARLRASPLSQKMAELPAVRTEHAPPFTHVGLDCFGPFSVVQARKEVKRWGLIFTCMSSRAVHLEVLPDMSTDAFLCALRRFIALRGCVQTIYCDQGTNFVGAERELRSAKEAINKHAVLTEMRDRGCKFVFNPPSASHFGGVWERMIRKTREVLSGLLASHRARLTADMLSTLFYEVAAIVNNRPLNVDSLEDPSVPFPLTPNHLLTVKPEPVFALPCNAERSDEYSVKRWRRVQYLVDQFWARWRTEYLASLQPRRKWYTARDSVRIGMLVLLVDENVARGQWKLGRIKSVFPSDDGLVRSVELQVASPQHGSAKTSIVRPTLLTRPVHKLIPLLVV